MVIQKQHAYAVGAILAFTLILLAINIFVPYGSKPEGPPELAKLKVVAARMHGGEAQRRLEFTTNQPILGDTSYKIIFGTKSGYLVDGTGILTSAEKQAGPTFLINVMELARFDQADKKKLIEEHVKAGNIHWVDVAIYQRGEFLHDPDVFTDSRKIAQARFDEP